MESTLVLQTTQETLTPSNEPSNLCEQVHKMWLTSAIEAMVAQATARGDAPASLGRVPAYAICHAGDRENHTGRLQALVAPPFASQRKRLDFVAGRAAAKAALSKIGLETTPSVARGVGGEPIWPAGTRGSITHCFPWSIAVAAQSSNVAIGVDLESARRLHELAIIDLICTAAEREWVVSGNLQTRLVMLFSAKEAVYKALYPLCKRYIDFKEVELRWLPKEECFACRFLTQPFVDWNRHEEYRVHCQWRKEFVVSLAMWNLKNPLPLQTIVAQPSGRSLHLRCDHFSA